MLGVISAACALVSFVLYAASAGKVPFTWQGLAILCLLFLAAHVTFPLYPWRRQPPP